MGLLVLGCIAAIVLTLVALVTIALVQIVLFISVRITLLLLLLVAVYGFVESRRRQVAKGFYTCTELPDTTAFNAPASVSTTASATSNNTETPTLTQSLPQDTVDAVAESQPPVVSSRKTSRKRSLSENGAANLAMFFPDGVAQDASSDVASNPDDANDEDQATTQQQTENTSPPSRLPGLRRKKWTTPSHSMPLKHKSESQLLRRSTSSASSSPRRPELYGSPRSVAMEQKLMKSALESDGYFIGDFRLPQPALPRRTRSTGIQQDAKASTVSDRTGPRAV